MQHHDINHERLKLKSFGLMRCVREHMIQGFYKGPQAVTRYDMIANRDVLSSVSQKKNFTVIVLVFVLVLA